MHWKLPLYVLKHQQYRVHSLTVDFCNLSLFYYLGCSFVVFGCAQFCCHMKFVRANKMEHNGQNWNTLLLFGQLNLESTIAFLIFSVCPLLRLKKSIDTTKTHFRIFVFDFQIRELFFFLEVENVNIFVRKSSVKFINNNYWHTSRGSADGWSKKMFSKMINILLYICNNWWSKQIPSNSTPLQQFCCN